MQTSNPTMPTGIHQSSMEGKLLIAVTEPRGPMVTKEN
uniref:Uncharacterized protein n=1 Tax=Rhizophora mucronata TaxID=61149 RepID=A0A2P2NXI5_RHIMU